VDGLTITLLVVIFAAICWQFRHRLCDLWDLMLHGKRTHCPKCGGPLLPDEVYYRHVTVWTCEDCGGTFETLKRN
jgi:ribosomal protein L37AE/L43A